MPATNGTPGRFWVGNCSAKIDLHVRSLENPLVHPAVPELPNIANAAAAMLALTNYSRNGREEPAGRLLPCLELDGSDLAAFIKLQDQHPAVGN